MLDPKKLRNETELVAEQLRRRGYKLDVAAFRTLESKRSDIQETTQALQAKRNQKSKAIGQAKAKGEDVSAVMSEMATVNDQLKQQESQLDTLQHELEAFQLLIPNILHDSVPAGSSEADNVEIRRWGTPTALDFTARDHVELGELTGQLDMERAAKLSGSRFVVLQGPLARLQRALAQFMLDVHTQQHGYREVYVPYLVQSSALQGTGQLPKFSED
ncbi:MAG TPA: serine--tRNA ligase, partial [Coxiellaceae bacterium]|nr:serine--tRNA ligase [Coxiellaceae bacterium]